MLKAFRTDACCVQNHTCEHYAYALQQLPTPRLHHSAFSELGQPGYERPPLREKLSETNPWIQLSGPYQPLGGDSCWSGQLTATLSRLCQSKVEDNSGRYRGDSSILHSSTSRIGERRGAAGAGANVHPHGPLSRVRESWWSPEPRSPVTHLKGSCKTNDGNISPHR